jgi:hypothetical protein
LFIVWSVWGSWLARFAPSDTFVEPV